MSHFLGFVTSVTEPVCDLDDGIQALFLAAAMLGSQETKNVLPLKLPAHSGEWNPQPLPFLAKDV